MCRIAEIGAKYPEAVQNLRHWNEVWVISISLHWVTGFFFSPCHADSRNVAKGGIYFHLYEIQREFHSNHPAAFSK
jgi:hypothetical protein